jgi:hypothetical protein
LSKRTAADYRKLRESLDAFREAYIEYLNNRDPNAVMRLRSQYNRLIPAADKALSIAGPVPAIAPPPMFGGGPYRRGLHACTSGVEQWDSSPQLIFDALDQAEAILLQRESDPEPEPEPVAPAPSAAAPVTRPSDRRYVSIPVPRLDTAEKVVSLIVGLVVLAGIVYGVLTWLV